MDQWPPPKGLKTWDPLAFVCRTEEAFRNLNKSSRLLSKALKATMIWMTENLTQTLLYSNICSSFLYKDLYKQLQTLFQLKSWLWHSHSVAQLHLATCHQAARFAFLWRKYVFAFVSCKIKKLEIFNTTCNL